MQSVAWYFSKIGSPSKQLQLYIFLFDYCRTDGWVAYSFGTSPVMSTYQVCVIVGEFVAVEAQWQNVTSYPVSETQSLTWALYQQLKLDPKIIFSVVSTNVFINKPLSLQRNNRQNIMKLWPQRSEHCSDNRVAWQLVCLNAKFIF